MAQHMPIVAGVPTRRELALHVASDAGVLYRRAPDMTVPPGAITVIPPQAPLPGSPGSLAAYALATPVGPSEIRYGLPRPMATGGIDVLWQSCPTTGLDLPADIAHEIWFDRNAGFSTFLTPSVVGLSGSAAGFARAAWQVLLRAPIDLVVGLLLDLAFRLDVLGPHDGFATRLAADLARRHPRVLGLVPASSQGRMWLNPRCLRWIVRELAAAVETVRAVGQCDLPEEADAEFVLHDLFPKVIDGDSPHPQDLVLAVWLLHEGFSGFDTASTIESDPLGALTALGFSPATRFQLFDRITTWSQIWEIPDTHPAGFGHWGQFTPSGLRAGFTNATGVAVRDWMRFSARALFQSFNAAHGSRPVTLDLGFAQADDNAQAMRALLVDHLGVTLFDLGRRVLAGTAEYTGLGSTSQAESSALHDRPLVVLSNGVAYIASADAFACAASRVPDQVVSGPAGVGARRATQGTLGLMFEAHGWNVVHRAAARHTVFTEKEIAGLAGTGQRADLVVLSTDGCAVLEFGIQRPSPGATRGDPVKVADLLRRYLRKAGQTTNRDVLDGIAGRTLGYPQVAGVVVVDEVLQMTPVHSSVLRATGTTVADLPAITIYDLSALAELGRVGHSIPHALIAWQRNGQKAPFSLYLHRLERLSGQVQLERTMTDLANLIADDAPATQAA